MPPSERKAILSAPFSAALDITDVRARLSAKRLGTRFHYFAELDSTNTRARELAESGAAEGEIVIAESQTQGRGRLGRRWESPPLSNLYLSIVLRPGLPPKHAPQITLAAAVALVETVGSFLPRPPVIKWPNDILIDGKKLAGILTEAACDTECVQYVILGIGLNLNYRAETMPETLRQRATSMADRAGENLSRETVLVRLIHDLDRCYGELEESGFAALRPRWEAHFGLRGRRVRVELGDQTIIGRAQGIDHEGALIVETDDEQRRSIIAGDVIPLET
ncbi:MAG TPA: biotin--[acetyl-CoA-carboxylase] ligase [Candidatus Binatia bacterium]|jgi:BirA family biotin operon repressor/biotin-[acetyl-CoA-carboxylase] ligase